MDGLNVKNIEQAEKEFSKIVKKTKLEYNKRLSKKYECNVFLKREDKQIVRSYKIRGAYNAMHSMSKESRKRGIVCASAGNHAQGVAICCNYFKIKGIIFMPKTTPVQKIQRTKKFGKDFVEIKLVGDSFDDAKKESEIFANRHDATFIHPFDDIKTIVGQGTIGVEILKQSSAPIDYLVAPIGGGGLISGIGYYFKHKSPKTKIVGVESFGTCSMYNSIKSGKIIKLNNIDSFVDGIAVKKVGKNTFKIVQKVVDEIKKIPEGRLCGSMLDFLQKEGIILEPAGALSVDALKDMKNEIKGKTVVCIISGGNFDFERLPIVKEKFLRYKGLKKYYIIDFPQRAGSLKNFLEILGPDDDIVRFEYLKKTIKENGPALVGIESKNTDNFKILRKKFDKNNIKYRDITDNDLFFDLLI